MSIGFYGAGIGKEWVIVAVIAALLVFTTLVIVISRLKKCPSDKIMVIIGRVNSEDGKPFVCMHGGARFIVPLIQTYSFLDLTPFSFPVTLKSAVCKEGFGVDISAKFSAGISTEQGIMQKAAEYLLGLSTAQIQELAEGIVIGQLRLAVAESDTNAFNDRDGFLDGLARAIETEFRKIGLRLININIQELSDEFGLMREVRRKAAEKALLVPEV